MKRASHIPAPRAAACDDLHLRTSAQHWHVSTFCVIGNSPEFPVTQKGDTRRYLHFYSFSSAASYVGMIQIRYTGLGDAANSQPDPSGSPVCLFSFFDKIYYILSARKSQVCTRFRTCFQDCEFRMDPSIFFMCPCSLLTALCSPSIFFPADLPEISSLAFFPLLCYNP